MCVTRHLSNSDSFATSVASVNVFTPLSAILVYLFTSFVHSCVCMQDNLRSCRLIWTKFATPIMGATSPVVVAPQGKIICTPLPLHTPSLAEWSGTFFGSKTPMS